MNLGALAFWLMLFIIGVTILKLLPYDKWKLTHQFMSLVFLLASLHFLLSRQRLSSSFPSLALLFIPMGFGLFGILYKQIWKPFFVRYPEYRVISAKKLNDNVMMVELKPADRSIAFTPGQYAFFSFRGKLPHEQHPFTVCSEEDDVISILAKVRGDFTRLFYDTIHDGERACLDGPYGRFDYTQGTSEQIWIAGGIGIVPFIAWCQTIKQWKGKITLYYCFHREIDAVFLDMFRSVQDKVREFHLHLFCSEKNEHLSVEEIQSHQDLLNKDIFMCGPRRLTHPFVKQLKKRGVESKRIHLEDFEFF
ncbi:MAG: hypothetical protein JJU12_07165 [Chlamydiales bacterium]|nr:hypothetical protein [Chlamydiales bacterium]